MISELAPARRQACFHVMYSGIVLSYYGAQHPKMVEQVFEKKMPSIFYGCPEN